MGYMGDNLRLTVINEKLQFILVEMQCALAETLGFPVHKESFQPGQQVCVLRIFCYRPLVGCGF
jgi:hypothetical protein